MLVDHALGLCIHRLGLIVSCPLVCYMLRIDILDLDDIGSLGDLAGGIEVAVGHALAIRAGEALATSEGGIHQELGGEDGHIRSIDITAVEQGSSLVTAEEAVGGQVRSLVDRFLLDVAYEIFMLR